VPINVQTTAVLLKAINAYVKLRAEIVTATLNAEIQYQLLKADAIVGFFVIFLEFNDAASVSDVQVRQLVKVLNDLASTIDAATKSVSKPLVDLRNAIDVSVKNLTKPLVDIKTASDLPAKSFTRAPIFDSIGKSDVVSLNPQKNLVEIQYNIEGPATGQNYVDPTYFAQDYSYDGFPTKLFNKSLLDYVDATDDFYGEANVDDDQIIFVNKTVADNAATNETLGKTFTRPGVVDSFAASDLALRLTNKSRTDTATFSDTSSRSYGKALTDTSNLSDALVRQYFKLFTDSASSTDARVFAIAKSLSDNVTSADAAAKSISRALTESTVLSDNVVRGANKGLTDTGTTSDSGNFRKTDYTDVNYFAQDYVGISVNF
jgi:hypothetical protein